MANSSDSNLVNQQEIKMFQQRREKFREKIPHTKHRESICMDQTKNNEKTQCKNSFNIIYLAANWKTLHSLPNSELLLRFLDIQLLVEFGSDFSFQISALIQSMTSHTFLNLRRKKFLPWPWVSVQWKIT